MVYLDMPSVHAQAQSLDDIRNVVRVLAAKVDARPSAFPTFGSSDHSGRPHIECSRDRFDYVVCERGSELETAMSQTTFTFCSTGFSRT